MNWFFKSHNYFYGHLSFVVRNVCIKFLRSHSYLCIGFVCIRNWCSDEHRKVLDEWTLSVDTYVDCNVYLNASTHATPILTNKKGWIQLILFGFFIYLSSKLQPVMRCARQMISARAVWCKLLLNSYWNSLKLKRKMFKIKSLTIANNGRLSTVYIHLEYSCSFT